MLFRSALPDVTAFQMQQPAYQAADNLSVSNAVNSLRAIGDADWDSIVERSSALTQLLCTSSVFQSESVATRDATLHAVERLSRRRGQSEVAVAHALLALMHGQEGVLASCNHWLHGAGRVVLADALGLRDTVAGNWRAAWRSLLLSPIWRLWPWVRPD